MNTTSIKEYVAKRAELLANLVLTRNKDVQLLRFQAPEDVGLDLFVQLPSDILTDGIPIQPCVGVKILGTDDSLETEADATAFVDQHWNDRLMKGLFLVPLVLFLFSMEGDKGYFGWILEPKVTREGPTLTPVSSLTMTKITKTSTDVIFRAATAWFDAMHSVVVRDKKSK